jgi:purine-binding chemotaxis protein CheW
MSADTKNTQAPGPARERTIYASFQLGDEEFALDVRHVQEVLNLPAAIVPMPLGPDFSLGVFNLRGSIIPLLGMDLLLGSQRPTRPDAKVVIVHHRGIRLGLTCDDTCRVLRPQGDELTLFAYEDRSSHGVVAGVLKLGEALVRVLDLNRLITLENVPHPQDALSANAAVKARLARKKCITFKVGAMRMAFPIGRIHEIVLVKGLEPSPVKDPLCEGVMHIRQNVVPVVRFASLLGCDAHAQQESADERVIVLEVGQSHVGLLVDTVESIDTYTDDQAMTVPVLTALRGQVCRLPDFGERGHVFLLDDQGGSVRRRQPYHRPAQALFATSKQTTSLASAASPVVCLRTQGRND